MARKNDKSKNYNKAHAKKKRRPVLHIGCTAARHARIGIHAVVNARGGLWHLNNLTTEDIEMRRDARKIQDAVSRHVRFYQFNSKHFRKAAQVQHLLSNYND